MLSLDSLSSVLVSTWRMWAVVLGGFVLFRACRFFYSLSKRLKRGF